MKKRILTVVGVALITIALHAEDFSPYYKLGMGEGDIKQVAADIKGKITAAGYDILGSYAPANEPGLFVIVFTNQATRSACASAARQGLLSATYRVGLETTDSGVAITTVNPFYQWRAYLTEDYEDNAPAFQSLGTAYMQFARTLGNGQAEPFGGSLDEDDLEDYHYMLGMPYYDDQVTIGEFDSYSQAVSQVQKNLGTASGIKHVYTLKNDQKKIAVFGIGLVDAEIGEPRFLPIIGQAHVAAMPYELIVDGNEVKMLHGRFRFALYWPELTMGTFSKIMSTPGEVEDMMKRLVK